MASTGATATASAVERAMGLFAGEDGIGSSESMEGWFAKRDGSGRLIAKNSNSEHTRTMKIGLL